MTVPVDSVAVVVAIDAVVAATFVQHGTHDFNPERDGGGVEPAVVPLDGFVKHTPSTKKKQIKKQ